MWGEWFRTNYRVLFLFALLLVLIAIHGLRRLYGLDDAVQRDFVNDATNLVLGALLGVLTKSGNDDK